MNEAPLFSIIVPACNVAPYVPKMVQSIKEQTREDFECIIINEESSDHTGEALTMAIGEDSRFQIISRPRSGSASNSRNYGIEHAKGKYLVFVDGDDWILPRSLEIFSTTLEHLGELDILGAESTVWQDFKSEEPIKQEDFFLSLPPDVVLEGKEALEIMLSGRFLTATWHQIYRRNLLVENHLYQIPGRRHQDDEWTYRVFFAAQRVAAVRYPYYQYRRRTDSITTSVNHRSLLDLTDNLISQFDFYRKHEKEMSKRLKKGLSTWICDFLTRYLRKVQYPRELRQQELLRLLSGERLLIFFSLLRNCRKTQLAGAPLLLLGCMRWFFPLAEWLFFHIYWPILRYRGKF